MKMRRVLGIGWALASISYAAIAPAEYSATMTLRKSVNSGEPFQSVYFDPAAVQQFSFTGGVRLNVR